MDIFSAFGLSASAGLNAYIPLLVVALVAKFTNLITLQKPWDTLTSWWVIGILAVLCTVEFFADKVPAVNHANDVIQTIVRPVAGAIVFASSAHVLTDIHPVISLAAGLFIAGVVHTAKSAAIRPAVTATTAGVGNVPVSLAEDLISTVTSLVAVILPMLIMVVVTIVLLLVVVWLWKKADQTA